MNFYDLAKSQNLSIATDVIFLDLAKAFDSVPHMHEWLLRGTCSDWSSLTSGTPQGTIFVPLLFLLCIDDITECVSSTIKLYADDTKIHRELADPFIDTQLLQPDLNNLNEWACKWQLCFHADKCESMHITHLHDKSVTKYFFEKNPPRCESLQRSWCYHNKRPFMG